MKSEQRLADVIAAIQAVASNEYYERRIEKWAGILGQENDAGYWRDVFNDHTEFFRSRPASDGSQYYSLIARRTLPHFEKSTGNTVYFEDYEKRKKGMSLDQKRETFGRPRLPDSQIKILIDVAISLHTKAIQSKQDWRWWIAPFAALIGTLLSASLAFIAAWQFHK